MDMDMINSEARNACSRVMLTPIHVPTPNHTNSPYIYTSPPNFNDNKII